MKFPTEASQKSNLNLKSWKLFVDRSSNEREAGKNNVDKAGGIKYIVHFILDSKPPITK